mgnify:CR=1 FL=1
MSVTIKEIVKIDSIECLPNGSVQVRKGTYNERTEVKTVPIYETQEVEEPVLDENGNQTTDSDGNVITQPNLVQIDTGETEEKEFVTESLIENWRAAIGVWDESLAESVLGEKKSIALAHWQDFPKSDVE